MSKLEVISEGYICNQPDEEGAFPRNARIALLPGGKLLASIVFHQGVGRGLNRSYAFCSEDLGRTWQNLGPIFPWTGGAAQLYERFNVNRTRDGHLVGLGMRWEIPAPGVPYYDPATGRTLDTDLYFAVSKDEGSTWSEARVIPLPYPEPPECGGVICETRDGRWLAPFAPWLDGNGRNANQGRATIVASEDRGATWPYWTDVLRAPTTEDAYGEIWVDQLSDGRVLATGWSRNLKTNQDHPISYSLSHDGGRSFGYTRSTGLVGFPLAHRPLDSGRAACIWANRGDTEPGLWFAIARPDNSAFHVEFSDMLWKAKQAKRGEQDDSVLFWADFSFGEPALEVLNDGTFFAVFWYQDQQVQGSRFCHFRLSQE